MISSLQRPQKLDALTSLRFFAAAMIVVGHAHPLFGSLGIANAARLEQGVSFFFVLSGFILAYNYPVLEGRHAVRQFWLARFARVWPLHAVMLLLWIALIFNFDRQSYFPGVEGLARLSANVLLLQAWIPLSLWSLSFNGVAWSISVEFFFYAVFPFLIRCWSADWHRLLLVQAAIVVTVIIICSVLALPSADTHASVGLLGLIYFNPLVRLLEFSVGISVAFAVRRIAAQEFMLSLGQWFVLELTAIGSCALALLAVADLSGIQHVFGRVAAYYFTREGLWLLFAMLIGVFALSRGPVTKLLSARPMVFLGEISFALYLCHAMVIRYLEPYEVPLREGGAKTYILFWVALLLLSAILFYGVEQPARAAILQAGDGKHRSDSAAIQTWAQRTTPVIAILALGGIAVSAVVFRPSMMEHLDDATVSRFLTMPGTNVIAGGATFDRRYKVLAFRVEPLGTDKVALQLLMRAEQDFVARDVAALHLNDSKGAMFDAPGDVVIDKTASITSAGTQWVQKFATTRKQYDKTHSIGMAMYKNPAVLYEVAGGNSDWNGRRLLLPKLPVGLTAETAS